MPFMSITLLFKSTQTIHRLPAASSLQYLMCLASK